jgi:hypothetical protein
MSASVLPVYAVALLPFPAVGHTGSTHKKPAEKNDADPEADRRYQEAHLQERGWPRRIFPPNGNGRRRCDGPMPTVGPSPCRIRPDRRVREAPAAPDPPYLPSGLVRRDPPPYP